MNMNIALIGYGKMGKEIESAAIQRGHLIVASFTSSSPLPPAASKFYKQHQIDCCIDFSQSALVHSHAEICSSVGIPLIEGTSGWQDQKDDVLSSVKKNNGTFVYGNNFSIGAQMFFRIVRTAALLMNSFSDYDVAIHETHHTKKKDSPSGTALTLANEIISQMQNKSSIKRIEDESVIAPHQISITSNRVGTVFGNHSVLFHSAADEIELTHRAHNRSGFAHGAILAAELTLSISGIFSFEELVFEKTFTHQ